jgi:signal transduction histidine kinase/AraC-like DNA-binding protein
VKASNNDGLWSSKEATLKIVIHPPFYWSLPAKLFYLLAFCVLIYLYVHIRLQKAERLHQRRLKEMNDRKEKEMREAQLHFFTMIAHEIRTPVSLIIGPLETLKDQWHRMEKKVSDGAAVSSTLDVIDRNAQRLLGLVNQLLDFNKVQQKELKVRFTLCHIKNIMKAVAERFEPTLKQNGATLLVEYPDEDFVAAVDAEGLTKIISNLMTNATKYTKDRVRLACRVEQDQFVIEVEDNGCGISPEEQQRIFSPFYQAKDNKPGTGIGLNIVSNLVAAHRGKVEVESEVGKGSLFRVTLPVSQPGVVLNEEPKPEVVDDIHPVETLVSNDVIAKQTVLVVEDNEDMLLYLKHNFMNRCQVLTAEDGVEALKLLNKYNVSLIISDWMMPNMDGEELCKKVRQNPKTSHIPFIMLTAKTDDDSKVKGMDIGADAFIEKPFSMRYLDACVRNLMARRKQLMEEFAGSTDKPIAKIADNAIDGSLLTDMERIIEDNVNNPALNVNFVAQQLGMSRSGLFAKIKSLTDTTPNEMIQVIRLRKAAQMLLEDKYSVSEISFLVGFNSASYFTKCFVKQFGVRPAEYRDAKKR